MERVNIVNGHLLVGKRAFPLKSNDVDVSTFNYSGIANIQNSQMRVVIGRTTIYDFNIGEATQESIDYEAGHERGKAQKRKRQPRNVSSAFYYGWLDAWKDKEA